MDLVDLEFLPRLQVYGLSSYCCYLFPCGTGRSLNPRPSTEAENNPNPRAFTYPAAKWIELLSGAGSGVGFSPELEPGHWVTFLV